MSLRISKEVDMLLKNADSPNKEGIIQAYSAMLGFTISDTPVMYDYGTVKPMREPLPPDSPYYVPQSAAQRTLISDLLSECYPNNEDFQDTVWYLSKAYDSPTASELINNMKAIMADGEASEKQKNRLRQFWHDERFGSIYRRIIVDMEGWKSKCKASDCISALYSKQEEIFKTQLTDAEYKELCTKYYKATGCNYEYDNKMIVQKGDDIFCTGLVTKSNYASFMKMLDEVIEINFKSRYQKDAEANRNKYREQWLFEHMYEERKKENHYDGFDRDDTLLYK